MDSQRKGGSKGQKFGPGVLVFLMVGFAVTPVMAVTDADVNKLGEECEAARQVALEPIRERRTQACIEQQLRSKEHCERYYTTYGNVAPSATGKPREGYFYDLPQCVAWLDARNRLRVSRSRP